MRADFFWRAWNKDKRKMLSPGNVRHISLEVGNSGHLVEMIEKALAAGASKGNGRTGIFEVQTDDGIWRRRDGRQLLDREGKPCAGVKYWAWEVFELEDMEDLPHESR